MIFTEQKIKTVFNAENGDAVPSYL